MIARNRLYIDGAWVAPHSTQVIEVINPATEQVIGSVPAGTAEDMDRAVRAASAAVEAWGQLTPDERAAWCARIAAELRSREQELSDLITAEVGCTASFSTEVQTRLPIDKLASMPELVASMEFSQQLGGAEVARVGVGVVAAITPWNYPLLQIVEKVAPALVAGCTVILKPSEVTPLNAFVLAEAAHAVGLPKGVFNLVSGNGPDAGAPLVAHPLVDMVSFTGSTLAGREISRVAAATVKITAMELGGKSASVVLPDVDAAMFDTAVRRAVSSSLSNSGQTCSALTRLVIPASRLARAEAVAREVAAEFTVGDPHDPATRLGPLVSVAQRDRVAGYVKTGLDEGAELITGGNAITDENGVGYYFQPTVFTKVTRDMVIAKEEIFGPVLVILTYQDDDIDDAVAIANGTDYGLAGAVWSSSPAQARAVAGRIKTGVISINGAWGPDDAPFGGFKQSGHGREAGTFGIEEYLTAKVYAF